MEGEKVEECNLGGGGALIPCQTLKKTPPVEAQLSSKFNLV